MGAFLDVDPCLSLDYPFLDLSTLEDLYQFCALLILLLLLIVVVVEYLLNFEKKC